jgi:glucosamine--fructose-6-phosphate aminotransferase (isomerizing)
MHEQPRVATRVLTEQRRPVQAVARRIAERSAGTVVFAARGSSDNAAVYGRYLLEACNHYLTSLAAPSVVTLYERGPRLESAVVFGVSQSGQGEDVLAYLAEARRQGAVTVALVNDDRSPLATEAEFVLSCLAGPELSIPATKTVTAEMTILAMLSAALTAESDRPSPDAALRIDADTLAKLPEAIDAALQQRTAAAALAALLAPARLTSVIGRGFAFAPALEIALKLKETSYTAAEPFSAADFLHGPVALVDAAYAALLVDVGGRSSIAARDIARAIRERGGRPALLRAAARPFLDDDLDNEVGSLSLEVPLPEPVAPIVALILGQLLAVELGLARGYDPAQPRGLRKVTSTR